MIEMGGPMRKRQIISLWIFAILWALTLLIKSSDYGWGFTQFIQVSIFWGVFGFIAHISLGTRKKDRDSDELFHPIQKLIKQNKYEEALDKIIAQEKNPAQANFHKELSEYRRTCLMALIGNLSEQAHESFQKEDYETAKRQFGIIRNFIVDNNLDLLSITKGNYKIFYGELLSRLEKDGNIMMTKDIPQLRKDLTNIVNAKFKGQYEKFIFLNLVDCLIADITFKPFTSKVAD